MKELFNERPKHIQTQNTISKWMTTDPITININETINSAIQIFAENNFYSIPVVDDHNFLEGMITKSSIMLALYQNQSTAEPIRSIIEASFDAVFPLDPLEKALNMTEGCLPVIKEDRTLIGIITRTDLLKAKSVEMDTVKHSLNSMSILQQVLDNSYEGIVVVDQNGLITDINSAYCRILGKNREEVLHQPVEEVIENTQLHLICKNGKEERDQIQRIHDKEMVVHRVPLFEKNQLIGAMGIIIHRSIEEMYHLTDKMTTKEAAQHLPIKHSSDALAKIVGNSPKTAQLKHRMKRMAALPSNVLITGESGTGKELYAQTLHALSPVSDGPFIAINCSAIPDNLLESELFGYVEGSFTGALKGGKKGKFELAENGTIFLDEIGDMPLLMQAKILRVLQERTIEPVGGTFSKKVNARVIAATNQHLEEKIAKKEFREDLFYRLNVLTLELPSLRQNKADVPLLLEYYLTFFASEFQLKEPLLSPKAREVLLTYDFPGNIRELTNLCEALVGMSEGGYIHLSDLPERIRNFAKPSQPSKLLEQKGDAERELILSTLDSVNYNKTICAEKLGIQRSTLYNKMKKYGIR
ncbi:sigma 54-interacting transcriptional regulator [Enterococcus sp. 669A]|uniref:Sigma 54-interacting transcriptional regulator n=1 Tax=Candidatus Enterococcus moelleringii TaxID=2815325 RepID=A0ABS3LBV1_9ENTE|nr:sigma-54-dependent Fis family transcriptional regulator [Enterococcus sp. 669A]MBO1307112.1 sigma 54-interacting transcriptional regulator [Enterococcus sp. 669A]